MVLKGVEKENRHFRRGQPGKIHNHHFPVPHTYLFCLEREPPWERETEHFWNSQVTCSPSVWFRARDPEFLDAFLATVLGPRRAPWDLEKAIDTEWPEALKTDTRLGRMVARRASAIQTIYRRVFFRVGF